MGRVSGGQNRAAEERLQCGLARRSRGMRRRINELKFSSRDILAVKGLTRLPPPTIKVALAIGHVVDNVY